MHRTLPLFRIISLEIDQHGNYRTWVHIAKLLSCANLHPPNVCRMYLLISQWVDCCLDFCGTIIHFLLCITCIQMYTRVYTFVYTCIHICIHVYTLPTLYMSPNHNHMRLLYIVFISFWSRPDSHNLKSFYIAHLKDVEIIIIVLYLCLRYCWQDDI